MNLASVAVGISCVGPLGEKQGFLSYPSGPSQHSLSSGASYVLYSAVVEKINESLSFFLSVSVFL